MKKEFIVQVSHLSKKFNQVPVIRDVSFCVEKGDIYGIFGSNGSGKTTLFRMISGLLHIDEGEGECLGYQIGKQSEQIKSKIGFMPQKFSLYGYLTIKKNLELIACLYGIKSRKAKIAEIIDILELKSRIDYPAEALSEGWKQRVSLACELIKQPELIILDEPTAGVDPNSRQEFWSAINHLVENGITVLLSTHHMDEALRCNKIAYIANGRILTQGTIEEIIRHATIYTWEITGNQTSKLAKTLEQVPHVDLVVQFGKKIHASGKNSFLLNKALKPYQNDFRYSWKGITPTIEDIFIYLSKLAERDHDAT